MITINVKSALICLLFIALIIFVIYLIVLMKNLIKSVKETNKILEDTAVITGIAAEKAVQIDSIITDVQGAVADVSQAVLGQKNLIGALTNIVKALGSLAAIFRGSKEEADTEQKRNKK